MKSKLFNPYGGLRKPKPLGSDAGSMNWESAELNSRFMNTQATPAYHDPAPLHNVKPPKGEK